MHRLRPAFWICLFFLLVLPPEFFAQTASQLKAAGNVSALSTPWQAVGPSQIVTKAYGKVTGRISSLTADPSDPSGNTLYVGTTGGGVWRSVNAAQDPSLVTFTPITDSIPGNSIAGKVSSSIGAISLQPGGTRVLLVGTGDPNNASDSYWGSGILRSADMGNTWTLITQSSETQIGYLSRVFMGEAVAGFAWSTNTPGLVVAAFTRSGESPLVNGLQKYSQSGLYYSPDAGVTWFSATVQDQNNQYVQRVSVVNGSDATAVVWNPIRKRFYAAIRSHGYYESLDGINWKRLLYQPGPGLTTTNCPTTTSSACPIYRGALAVQPVNGDLFALTVDVNNLDQGVWQDQCQFTGTTCVSSTVQFGKPLPSTALDVSVADKHISQGGYNLWLAAVPTVNDTLLFAGTQDIFRCSVSAGCVWRNTTNVNTCAAAQVAPSQHAVEASFASTLGLLFFGNDGGLWRTTDTLAQQPTACTADDAAHFQNLNSGLGSLSEVTDFAADPADPAIMMASFGAFGTAAPVLPGQPLWQQILGGEGSHVAIDPAHPLNWFSATSTGVSLHACTFGQACTSAQFGSTLIGSAQVGGDGYAMPAPAPWSLDPQDTSRAFIGTCRLWRGPALDGSAWNSTNLVSSIFDGGKGTVCNSNAWIRSIAASGTVSTPPATQEMVYVGMAGPLDGGSTAAGHLYRASLNASSNSSTQWTDISKSLVQNDSANLGKFNPGAFAIAGIAIDPHDTTAQTVYISIPGFSGNNISTPLLYGTWDGGASWTNLTGNIPIAPANTILVDPNDGNTVYVGTDLGVYVTRQIATCFTSMNQCWSAYGTGLPNTPITKLSIFNSGQTTYLRAATYGRGIWQIPLVTAPPTWTTATLTPTALTFPDQPVQTAGTPQTLTLTNTGTLPLTLSQITSGPDFAESDNCGGTVAAGGSCLLQISFVPTQMGARQAALTLSGNLETGQITAALSGNGVAGAAIVLNPTSVDFGSAIVGGTGPVINVTISNTGGIPIALDPPVLTADFQMAVNTCGASLPTNTGCTVAIRFAPSRSGNISGAMTVTDDLGTQTVQLTGNGQSNATDAVAPLTLGFGDQVVNTVSLSQSVTVTNSGDLPLTDLTAAATGDFTVSNGCGSSLVGHASCAIQVSYLPTRTGPATGVLTIKDAVNSVLHTQTVALTGNGMAAATDTIAPLSLLFSAQVLNTASATQPVVLTNSGDAALTLIVAQVSGDFTISNGCGANLNGHSSCAVNVAYLPTQVGPETGTLTITDANGSHAIALSGSGLSSTSLDAAPTSLNFSVQTLGTTSTPQSITLTNRVAVAMNSLSVAVAGDFSIGANSCGSSLASGASCVLQMLFTPTAAGTRAGSISVLSSTLPGLLTIPLSGTGQLTVTDTLSAQSLTFPDEPLNVSSPAQTVTVTNSGDGILTGIVVQVTGDFILTNGCAATLGPHLGCVLSLTYRPTALGPGIGTLTITDSLRTQTVALAGTGLAPPTDTLAPLALVFPGQALNLTSTSQRVTLSNTGDVPLTGISATITGDFRINSGCAATLAAHSTCGYTVVYLPTIAGPETGTLVVTDSLGSQTVTLSGTGLSGATDSLSPYLADLLSTAGQHAQHRTDHHAFKYRRHDPRSDLRHHHRRLPAQERLQQNPRPEDQLRSLHHLPAHTAGTIFRHAHRHRRPPLPDHPAVRHGTVLCDGCAVRRLAHLRRSAGEHT